MDLFVTNALPLRVFIGAIPMGMGGRRQSRSNGRLLVTRSGPVRGGRTRGERVDGNDDNCARTVVTDPRGAFLVTCKRPLTTGGLLGCTLDLISSLVTLVWAPVRFLTSLL